jgi:peptide/nickel transport system substrate-binding protein
MELREAFDYPLSRLDPFADHIDPPSVAVYETLMVKGPDGLPHPGLAISWQISDDGLEWRLQLRPGARYHSGDPCNAVAVVEALEALRYGFHGGQQLWYWDAVDTVQPVGEDQILFRLHHPYSRLPSLLWGTHTAIHNERRRAADPDGSGIDWADGTGPFHLEHFSQERVEVVRWDGYPGSDATFLRPTRTPLVQRITWISILDPAERVAALEEGAVDCLHGPNYADVARLEDDPRFDVVRFSQASNLYLAPYWPHTELGFADLEIRQALSLAIDRDRVVRDALLGYGAPTIGPLAVDGEFYDPAVEALRAYDPHRASEMLDQAGWQRGPSGIRERDGVRFSFECVIQDDAIHRKAAETIRDSLLEVGIEMRLRPVLTFKGFYEACRTGPNAFINKWLWQDPVDASLGFNATRGQPDPNWQLASVPELDQAYREWLLAGPPTELQAAASVVQRIAAENLPNIPVAVPQDVWVRSKRVHGWDPAQAILYPFYHTTYLD